MEYTFRLPLEVYNYNVHIIYTDDIERSRKAKEAEIGKLKKNVKTANGLHSHFKGDPDSYIFLTPESDPGTIAHEAYHAVDALFDYIGADHENELTAYHLGFIVDHIHSFKDYAEKDRVKEEVLN